MEMTWSLRSSLMPRTPGDSRPLNTRTSATGKRIAWPSAVVSSTSSWSPHTSTADDAVAGIELHGDLAVLAHLDEVGELVAAHVAAIGGEHHVELLPRRLVLGQRQDGGDGLVLVERQQIDERLAAGLRRRDRQAPDRHLVDHAARGEEQHRRMGVGDEDAGDEILFARRHAGAALAAAALGAIGGERHALDVAPVADGDDHVLALDQVLVLDLAFHLEDLGAARRTELGLDRGQLVLDDRDDAGAGAQDVEIVGDLVRRASSVRRRSRRGRARSGAAGADRGWRGPARRRGGRCRWPRPCGADRRSARPARPRPAAGQSRAINCSRAVGGIGRLADHAR